MCRLLWTRLVSGESCLLPRGRETSPAARTPQLVLTASPQSGRISRKSTVRTTPRPSTSHLSSLSWSHARSPFPADRCRWWRRDLLPETPTTPPLSLNWCLRRSLRHRCAMTWVHLAWSSHCLSGSLWCWWALSRSWWWSTSCRPRCQSWSNSCVQLPGTHLSAISAVSKCLLYQDFHECAIRTWEISLGQGSARSTKGSWRKDIQCLAVVV